MKIPYDHPFHSFIEIEGLSPIPSATGAILKTCACSICGIMGTVKGSWFILSESAHRVHARAKACEPAAAPKSRSTLIKVKTERLLVSGVIAGSFAKPAIIPAALVSETVLVTSPSGEIVGLYPGEYELVVTRTRTRAKHA